MTKTDLLLLANEYPTRVKFVQAFNEASGGKFLDETTLARQISGNIGLTRPWMAAYQMFEKYCHAIRLLRHLADLQNGPPLVMYEDEWTNTMKEVYEFLDEKEKDYLTAAD